MEEFLRTDNPRVDIRHPWRQFDEFAYAKRPWEDHLRAFLADRQRWLDLQDQADWSRTGKWNGKPDTIGGLTQRLARHEEYHIAVLEAAAHRP